MTQVWEQAPYAEGTLLVLLALADWSNDEGMSWPSVSRLAQKARLERRQVQRIIKKLQLDGALTITYGAGRGNQNVYQINSDKMSPFKESEKATSVEEKVTFGTQKVTLETQKVSPMTPDPLEDTLEDTSAPPTPPQAGETGAQEASPKAAKQPLRSWERSLSREAMCPELASDPDALLKRLQSGRGAAL